MRVALINQFYPPAQAPTGILLQDLARTLQQRGHRVTVVTSAGIYAQGAGERATPAETGIEVHRVGSRRRHRTGVFAKLLDYVRFFLAANRVLAGLAPAPAVVVCMTTPPFCGVIGARRMKRRGTPCMLWCMDLYPEAIAANGWIRPGSLAAGLLYRLARWERTAAAAVITLGPDMTVRVRSAAPAATIVEVPVWSRLRSDDAAQAAARALRRERGWRDDETVLLYSGNMGRAHSVARFVALADAAGRAKAGIRFVFCGSGPSADGWRAAGGAAFEWLSPVRDDLLVPHLLAADVHLLSQRVGWTGVVVPSKYQAACALGRPVVFDGPAESSVAQWIRAGDTGWVLGDDEAPDALLAALQNRERIAGKGCRAYQQAERLFSCAINAGRIADAIERMGGPGV